MTVISADPTAGFRLLEFDDIDSTNLEARRQWDSGERGPMWIVAGAQSKGRGRQGRDWASPPGNLYATLYTGLNAPASALPQLGLLASLAVYDLATHALKHDAALSLKWPNDVLLGGRKVSGILAETVNLALTGPSHVAIGCGVNLRHAPAVTRYGATTLAEHGADISPGDAAPVLFEAMAHWLQAWNGGSGFETLRQEWMKRSDHLGTVIGLDLGTERIEGTFATLASDGGLVLELPDGTRRTVHAGDVLQSRPQAR
jgi:BirA family biotin operon repressor/biotin-[acetyl-CoA-carboxylase] ligase